MLGVLFAAAVSAAANASTPAPSVPPKATDAIVCRNEPIDGSRITHKVCRRASEIARLRQDARQGLGQMQGSVAPTMMGPMH